MYKVLFIGETEINFRKKGKITQIKRNTLSQKGKLHKENGKTLSEKGKITGGKM